MKRLLKTTALAVLAGTFAIAGTASAQDWRHHDDRGYHDRGYHDDRHGGWGDRGHYDGGSYRNSGWHDRSDWRRGGYVGRGDWDRGYRVDYRRYHLSRPPYGYEWRRVNDNYVLAAVATGLIASVIINGN